MGGRDEQEEQAEKRAFEFQISYLIYKSRIWKYYGFSLYFDEYTIISKEYQLTRQKHDIRNS